MLGLPIKPGPIVLFDAAAIVAAAILFEGFAFESIPIRLSISSRFVGAALAAAEVDELVAEGPVLRKLSIVFF
jgi:hypothetical protein